MKSAIKKLKNCKKVLEIKLSPERVKDEFEKVYNSIKKVASVPGYRVGNVPRDLLELHYGKTAEEEVIKNLIPETYREVLEQYKLEPISYPDITDVSIDLEQGLSYKANIETRPEFLLRSYKGLRLKRKDAEPKEEDINRNLEALREANAQKVPKKEGDDKEIILPKLDDEFAKDLGFDSMKKLKEAIRTNLKHKLDYESHQDLEMQVINKLVDSVNFEVPESLVKAEKERLMKDANARIAYMEEMQKREGGGKKIIFTDGDKKELEQNAEKQAVKQVKTFFILDKIAQLEKIYITSEELEQTIEEIAAQYRKTKEEIKKLLEEKDMLNEIAVNMRNAKVMDFLIKEAKIV